jgi:hypothetical protein
MNYELLNCYDSHIISLFNLSVDIGRSMYKKTKHLTKQNYAIKL